MTTDFFQTEGPLVVEKQKKKETGKKVADYGKEDSAKFDLSHWSISQRQIMTNLL